MAWAGAVMRGNDADVANTMDCDLDHLARRAFERREKDERWQKLVVAGLPVPRTKIIKMPLEAQKVIWKWFDGEESHTGDEEAFFEELHLATLAIGFPCFLRTDHTSAKHSWDETCFVESFSNLKQHVFNIAEFSETTDMIGLPWDTWVVREFLPTIPVGVCSRYGNMPVCREFRYFIEDGRYCCSHPYWPKDSLIEGGFDLPVQVFTELCAGRTQELDRIAIAAGKAVGAGAWGRGAGWPPVVTGAGASRAKNGPRTSVNQQPSGVHFSRYRLPERHSWRSAKPSRRQ